ncbi:MerR family transcriptional regulator [Streptomyces sp. TRM 70351]|uniref:MerR family transcriptional regulator n=1 Tax=Streptomyces sp. TRM 70351 TaxID=3116552 RepID=UPI002E7C1BD9|nr:MerR family transcriptional regulator [Streptomyces sp. TRM 70351]MEE1927166.1 MerR family transcriptional regulator [Streptomyces sp. TRM 70351]
MEWSIQDIARRVGTTSRTLRHYDELGLLVPSRVGANGYRYYGQDELVRLQRILLLRQLGLSLSAIAEILAGQQETAAALRTHLALLEQERERIGRQITAVRTTLDKTTRGEQLMPEEVLDGFDHTRYEEEVTRRWGRDAYVNGDRWWRSLTDGEKRGFKEEQAAIAAAFVAAFQAGQDPAGDEVQDIARRHCAWLSGPVPVSRSYVIGLAGLYVADPRFGVHYEQHAPGAAEFVRDALTVYAERHLTG